MMAVLHRPKILASRGSFLFCRLFLRDRTPDYNARDEPHAQALARWLRATLADQSLGAPRTGDCPKFANLRESWVGTTKEDAPLQTHPVAIIPGRSSVLTQVAMAIATTPRKRSVSRSRLCRFEPKTNRITSVCMPLNRPARRHSDQGSQHRPIRPVAGRPFLRKQ